MATVAVFVGSLRTDSLNRKLAKNLELLARDRLEFRYVDLTIPLFNQDYENNYPKEARQLKAVIEEADGVLFVTPEYNRSIPGVLKNAIDWASRPKGHNSFNAKPTGIVGASSGVIGTAVAQSDLRHICGFLNVKLMGQPELYLTSAEQSFDESGLADQRAQAYLSAYIDAFAAWVENEK